jgi:Na+/H+ antiporter NhaD/arsenite permease-like protein
MDHIPLLFQFAKSPTMPSTFWTLPFVALLLSIAILPLVPSAAHWWEKNRNKLLVSLVLAAITCAYYTLRGYGFHHASPGVATTLLVLRHAVIDDYVPFIVLLFSLYTISGGINLKGDVPAHPLTNTAILAIGTLGASFIGTTGMAMLLIRPLLQINSERRHVRHTVVFFIFLVCNIGGCLLPIGDPPLFLGYLRRVPFFWTLKDLIPEWAVCSLIVLAVYYVWETLAYRTEERTAIVLDESVRRPLRLSGKRNFILLLGVVVAVVTLVPDKKFPGTNWTVPHLFLREIAQLVLAGVSLWITPRQVRKDNAFNFVAIGEVACLFIGIFITMQVPIEILHVVGPRLADAGFTHPWHFFWASGLLSSFLDNAPTYVVFFSTAATLAPPGMPLMTGIEIAPGQFGAIPIPLLVAVSCGSVFMGANTYIGNGPNFMVKSIAEQSGVRMPSFFGYMLYSGAILLPVFFLITFIFFR